MKEQIDTNESKIFRLAELFCGPGGIGLGAHLADVKGIKIDHLWATDYDKDTCETYKLNVKPKAIICEDIRKLDFSNIHKKYGDIDCLSFGFPCNDFSTVGEQKGIHGNFGALYQYCINALKEFMPNFFVAENVSGIRNANDGFAFTKILNEFKDCGYNIYPNLYCFEDYGIPQKRHRVIIIGIKKKYTIRVQNTINKSL